MQQQLQPNQNQPENDAESQRRRTSQSPASRNVSGEQYQGGNNKNYEAKTTGRKSEPRDMRDRR